MVGVNPGGGGALIVDASPTFAGCRFSGNRAGELLAWLSGGAVHCVRSSSRFEECEFRDNASLDDAGSLMGGAVFASESSLVFVRCGFANNEGADDGGAVFGENVHVTLLECRFDGNYASRGGAVSIHGPGAVNLVSCEFLENYSGYGGGAVRASNCTVAVTDSRFVENGVGDADGGAMFLVGCDTVVERSLFIRNRAVGVGGGGAVSAVGLGTLRVGYCTLVGNYGDSAASSIEASGTVACIFENLIVAFGIGDGPPFSCANATIRCCDVFGNHSDEHGMDWFNCEEWVGVNGNFSADPLFCNPSADDFALAGNSPCLPDAGCDVVGALGQGCEVTPVEVSSWGGIKGLSAMTPRSGIMRRQLAIGAVALVAVPRCLAEITRSMRRTWATS
jgi:predicted outer membrane repeat protein